MAFMNKQRTASATEPVDEVGEVGPAAQKMLAERESEVSAVKTKPAKTSHNIPATLPGTVCQQRVKRGHKRHRYYARFWTEDGRWRKQYVRLADVEAVRAACAARRVQEKEERARRDESMRVLRACRRLLRELDREH